MGMIQLIQAAVTQATATAVGSNPMLTQAEMAMGANTNREPKLAPVKRSAQAGEQCEHQYDDKWADTGTQSAGHRVTHHGGEAGVRQGAGHADDAGHHKNQRRGNIVAHFLEIEDAQNEQYGGNDTGDGIARLPQLIQEDHSYEVDHESNIHNDFFPPGQLFAL